MAEVYSVKCSCGYEGTAYYREKDNPYSSYGIWSFNGLNCELNTVEKPLQMGLGEALSAAKPHCPQCKRKIDHADIEEKK